MQRTFSVLILAAALFGGACGSVQNVGGMGGSPGATGGTGGQAGAPGTGGGTGGTPATGGQAGGGHGGTGGGGGHGGAAGGGAGGHAGGAGGHAGEAGGAGGEAGHHGDGGQTCDEIKAAFTQALAAAMSCTPGAQHQCETLALIAPLDMCPGCSEYYVNDATTINALRAQWGQQSCGQPTLCPAIPCVIPHPVTCAAGDGSSGATCQATPATTN